MNDDTDKVIKIDADDDRTSEEKVTDAVRTVLGDLSSNGAKRAYDTDWNRFSEWLAGQRIDPLDVTPKVVGAYVRWMRDDRKLSRATIGKSVMRSEVRVIEGAEGRCYWNIMWSPAHPQRNGRWPASHPCYGDPTMLMWEGGAYLAHTGPLGRFRDAGYYASCFPEGDGISFRPLHGQTLDQVARDVAECFGCKVTTGSSLPEMENR